MTYPLNGIFVTYFLEISEVAHNVAGKKFSIKIFSTKNYIIITVTFTFTLSQKCTKVFYSLNGRILLHGGEKNHSRKKKKRTSRRRNLTNTNAEHPLPEQGYLRYSCAAYEIHKNICRL